MRWKEWEQFCFSMITICILLTLLDANLTGLIKPLTIFLLLVLAIIEVLIARLDIGLGKCVRGIAGLYLLGMLIYKLF